MFLNITQYCVYSSYKIKSIFSNINTNYNIKKESRFVVSLPDGMPAIISNRHVFDIRWNDKLSKFHGYNLNRIIIRSRTSSDVPYSCTIDCTSFNDYNFLDFHQNTIMMLLYYFGPLSSD